MERYTGAFFEIIKTSPHQFHNSGFVRIHPATSPARISSPRSPTDHSAGWGCFPKLDGPPGKPEALSLVCHSKNSFCPKPLDEFLNWMACLDCHIATLTDSQVG